MNCPLHQLQDAKRSLGALLETIERLEADSGDSPAPDQEELERRIQEVLQRWCALPYHVS